MVDGPPPTKLRQALLLHARDKPDTFVEFSSGHEANTVRFVDMPVNGVGAVTSLHVVSV
jgi:hypothetical protein